MTSHAGLSYVFLLSSSCQSGYVCNSQNISFANYFIKNKNKNEEAALQVPTNPQHLLQLSVAGSYVQHTLVPSLFLCFANLPIIINIYILISLCNN